VDSNYQMSLSDFYWHWQAASRCYLSIAYTLNGSVYMLQIAVYSACNFISIFVTMYRTLLHVADIHTRYNHSPCLLLSASGRHTLCPPPRSRRPLWITPYTTNHESQAN